MRQTTSHKTVQCGWFERNLQGLLFANPNLLWLDGDFDINSYPKEAFFLHTCRAAICFIESFHASIFTDSSFEVTWFAIATVSRTMLYAVMTKSTGRAFWSDSFICIIPVFHLKHSFYLNWVRTVTIPKVFPKHSCMSPGSATLFFWDGDCYRICPRVRSVPKEYGDMIFFESCQCQ